MNEYCKVNINQVENILHFRFSLMRLQYPFYAPWGTINENDCEPLGDHWTMYCSWRESVFCRPCELTVVLLSSFSRLTVLFFIALFVLHFLVFGELCSLFFHNFKSIMERKNECCIRISPIMHSLLIPVYEISFVEIRYHMTVLSPQCFISGLAQDCSNPSASAMQFLQSCAKPLISCTDKTIVILKWHPGLHGGTCTRYLMGPGGSYVLGTAGKFFFCFFTLFLCTGWCRSKYLFLWLWCQDRVSMWLAFPWFHQC